MKGFLKKIVDKVKSFFFEKKVPKKAAKKVEKPLPKEPEKEAAGSGKIFSPLPLGGVSIIGTFPFSTISIDPPSINLTKPVPTQITITPEMAAEQVKRILKDNTFKREVLTTTGKLNFNRLASYKTSKKLFNKTSETQGKKYNIELLIDNSGSMVHGGRHINAIRAGEQIAATMGKYCDLNIVLFNFLEKVVSFKDFKNDKYLMVDPITDNWLPNCPEEIVIAEDKINGNFIAAKSKIESSSILRNYGHETDGNWEVINVLNAAKRLKRKGGHKIILILLDGRPDVGESNELKIAGRLPSKYPRSDHESIYKKVISEGIELVAFGIDTYDPQSYFPNFHYVRGGDVLPELIKALKTIIK